MKNRKDLLAIVGLLILITLFSFFYLYLKPALSQTAQKYTVFKTENQGFKFVKRERILVGAYYEGENTKINYGFAPTSDIGKRYYLYGITATDNYNLILYSLSCDKTYTDIDCPNRVFESTTLFPTDPPQYLGDLYKQNNILKQKVYKFIEPVIVKPDYKEVEFNFAPIFAQTPTATSPGEQVVTKEYLHSITDHILYTITKNPAEPVSEGKLSLSYYTYVRDSSRDVSGHVGNRLPCDTSWRDKDCPDSYNVPTDLGEYAYDWDGGCSFFGGCWRYSYAYKRKNATSSVGSFLRYDLLGYPYMMRVQHTGGVGNSSPIPMDLFDTFCGDVEGCPVYIYQWSPIWGKFGRCIKFENYIHCDWGDTAAAAIDGNNVVQHLSPTTKNCYLTDAKVVNGGASDNEPGLYLYQAGGSIGCAIVIQEF